MDIRAELEHENVIPVDKDDFTSEMVERLSADYNVLMLCDLSEAANDEERLTYAKSLADAGVIEADQTEPVLADKSLLIVVPFHTLEIAQREYRKIAHATHFVRMYVDGRPYSTC